MLVSRRRIRSGRVEVGRDGITHRLHAMALRTAANELASIGQGRSGKNVARQALNPKHLRHREQAVALDANARIINPALTTSESRTRAIDRETLRHRERGVHGGHKSKSRSMVVGVVAPVSRGPSESGVRRGHRGHLRHRIKQQEQWDRRLRLIRGGQH